MHAASPSSAPRPDIAVMDRNPHVREFLCRELSGQGFAVSPLPNAGSLLLALGSPRPPRVLVLDPEAVGASLADVVRALLERAGQVTVVLHVFEGEDALPELPSVVVAEKRPDMSALKAALASLAAGVAPRRDGRDEA